MDFYRAVSNKNMIVRSMTETNRKALGFDTTKLTSGKLQDRASIEHPHNNKTMHSILSTRCLCEKVTTTMTPCRCKPCDMNSL